MLSDGGLQSRSGGNRADEDVDLTAYARTTDLAGYATLATHETFTGNKQFTSSITVEPSLDIVNSNSLDRTHFNYLNNGINFIRGTTEVTHNLTVGSQSDTSNLTVTGALAVTGNATAGGLTVTGNATVNNIVSGFQIKATGTFTATTRTNLGGTGTPITYQNGVDPVLHVMHDSAWNVGRWVARATDGTWGWVAGSQSGFATLPSDDRLKYNEVPVAGAIEYVKALQPRHYTKKKSLVDADEGGIEEYGFIAQDVESIEGLECLVVEDLDCRDPNLRVKHLNYNGVMTISMQALKELITRVEDLETRLAALESS